LSDPSHEKILVAPLLFTYFVYTNNTKCYNIITVAPVGQTLVPSFGGDILSPTSNVGQSSLPVKTLDLQHSRKVRSFTRVLGHLGGGGRGLKRVG